MRKEIVRRMSKGVLKSFIPRFLRMLFNDAIDHKNIVDKDGNIPSDDNKHYGGVDFCLHAP